MKINLPNLPPGSPTWMQTLYRYFYQIFPGIVSSFEPTTQIMLVAANGNVAVISLSTDNTLIVSPITKG